ncbi:hypothetical protein FIV42_17540 [Persicimonas caeni]|uniref:DUF2029 domain-containing protein n=1 Tax=Persicimonas caeni TaxID=2292766 RepID=A0A4Y6PVU8_PERCE|nr:hypothetical protein [Persicimonas caeni]QDG52474.1 hypothetical protein FIV42_17540 [Persicimonas caeni]QED33696.1 hypothetical protein FRD00_17535 [Persicimonas caeni]
MLHEPGSSYQLPERELEQGQTVVSERGDDESLFAFFRRRMGQKAWVLPLIIFVVSAAVYSLFAWERVKDTSTDPHFIYFANTLNTMVAAELGDEEAVKKREGKYAFELDRRPPHRNDWASWWDLRTKDGEHFRGIWLDDQGQGRFKTLDNRVVYLERNQIDYRERKQRFFVSFPPMPSFLMMPLAAIWGYEVNDVVWTIFFAALNAVLMYLLLKRLSIGGRTGRGRDDNLWLTLLFAFGSAHLWCSVMGQVWFTALIMGVTFTLLYMLCAIDARHPLLAGIFLALGFATRAPLVFTAIFFFAFVFFPGGKLRKGDWGDAIKKLALFCAPCLIVGLSLLWMNHIRFESFTEFGHRYLAAGSLERIQRFGLFNVHFLSKNLSALITLIPRFQPDAPFVVISKHGMSLFLTTPAFFYLFLPEERKSDIDKFWWRLLWVTVAVVAIPHLMYQNTGYAQFGYRFALDYMPYLIVLLAVGRRPLSKLFKALVLVGIAVNAFGAVTFNRFSKFYSERFFV